LEPPLVLFCLRQRSGVGEVLRDTRYFAVNILAEDQEDVSVAFAKGSGPRFSELPFHTAATGAPILDNSLAYLDCHFLNDTDSGDHFIIIGEVVDLAVQRVDSHPLMFFRSSHRKLGGKL